ncbi:hypothetical protein ACHAXH_006676 [Discostella pseudostelligera]
MAGSEVRLGLRTVQRACHSSSPYISIAIVSTFACCCAERKFYEARLPTIEATSSLGVHGEEASMEKNAMRISAIVNRTDGGSQRGSEADQKNFSTESTIICAVPSKNRGICPSFRRNVHDAPRINQYALYVNEELSPRSSGWLYLTVVSMACLSSFLISENSINESTTEDAISDGGIRSSIDTLLISILSISFGLSFLITLFYHHRDLREKITKDIAHVHNSLEFFLSLLLFGFWCTILRYATDPYSDVSLSSIGGKEEIFNTNMWVCTWIGFGLASYLVGSLVLASPVRKRGVVCTRGFTEDIFTARRNSTRGDCTTVLATDVRWGEEMVYWFMLLAFSSALAGFSISTRAGGGAIGIMCALLAFAALIYYRMDKRGTFDQWGSKRKLIASRINSILPSLALVLQSVNMGFGTNTPGPSTYINSSYVASFIGIMLSLMLCEQATNRSVLRLLPPPPHRVEIGAEENNLRGDGLGNIDEDHSSFSSSSHASSSSASASASASAETFESSSECAVVPTPRDDDQLSATTDVESGFDEPAHRDHSSCDPNSMSEAADESASSASYLSTGGLTNDASSKDTYSTYTIPQAPPTYSPSSSPPQPTRSLAEGPYPPPPSVMMHVDDAPSEIRQNPTDDDSNTYVELSFQPDDDVSSIGFSAIPGDKFGKEPDGYKYDDLYTPSDDPIVPLSDGQD